MPEIDRRLQQDAARRIVYYLRQATCWRASGISEGWPHGKTSGWTGDRDGERLMAAPSFGPILEAAQTRFGGAALQARLTQPRTPAELKALTDDRYLSQMSLRIFRAGLKHSLVDAKWPAFEEVFGGFEPRRVRAMSDEALQALLADTRLIRHWGKLKSVRDNAAAMIAVSEERGNF